MKAKDSIDYESRFNLLSDAVNGFATSLEVAIGTQENKIEQAKANNHASPICEGRRIQALVALNDVHRIIDFYCASPKLGG